MRVVQLGGEPILVILLLHHLHHDDSRLRGPARGSKQQEGEEANGRSLEEWGGGEGGRSARIYTLSTTKDRMGDEG